LISILVVEISVASPFRFIGSIDETTPELLESAEAVGGRQEVRRQLFLWWHVYCFLYDLNFIHLKFIMQSKYEGGYIA